MDVNARRALLVVGLVALPAIVLWPQTNAPERPEFDATSVKPDKADRGFINFGNLGAAGGLYRATNVTLSMLIISAYQLKPQQIVGLPNWANAERFDIEARAEGGPDRSQKLLMLQSLLADRFSMVVHHETREAPIYALVVAKEGKTGPQLQLHPDEAQCRTPGGFLPRADGTLPPGACGNFSTFFTPKSMHTKGQKITVAQLADHLSTRVDRVVVDQTGLTGLFDVDIEYAPFQASSGAPSGSFDTSAADASGLPSIFTAVEEQLGLKLKAQTGPLDVVVIDRVEEPSPN